LVQVVDHGGDPRTVRSGRHRIDRPLATIRLYGKDTPTDGAGTWLPLTAGVAPAIELAVTLAPIPVQASAPVMAPAPIMVAEPGPAPVGEEVETRRFDAMFGATYHPVRQDEFAAPPAPPAGMPPIAMPPIAMPSVVAPTVPAPPPPVEAAPAGGRVLGLADINWATAAAAASDPAVSPAPMRPVPAPRGPAPAEWPPRVPSRAAAPVSGLDDELRQTVLRDRPESVPGPTVTAVRCNAGHLNPDTATACRACPAGIAPQSPIVVARPILGRLLLPDGDAITLDRGVILGRAPGVPDPADPDRPHHVKLRSPDGDISRKHVEIRLDGWRVLALDLHSSNGTYVARPGDQPYRIVPGEPVELEPGGGVHLNADVAIRFEVSP
jgi:hypothetical protein